MFACCLHVCVLIYRVARVSTVATLAQADDPWPGKGIQAHTPPNQHPAPACTTGPHSAHHTLRPLHCVCQPPLVLQASSPVLRRDRPEGLPSRHFLHLDYRGLSVVEKEKGIHLIHLDFSVYKQITIHRHYPIRSTVSIQLLPGISTW